MLPNALDSLIAISGDIDALLLTNLEMVGRATPNTLAALVTDDGFDVAAVASLAERLPRSALPRFVSLRSELPRTASLKLQRRALSGAGFDPELCPGPVWLLDGARYRPVDAEAHRDIVSGKVRL